MNLLKKGLISILMVITFIIVMPAVVSNLNNAYVVKAASVKINKTKYKMYIGEEYKLKITGTSKKVKWSSSNKKVATVNSKGKVKAKKKGRATIIAKVGKKKYKCKAIVKATPTIKQAKLLGKKLYKKAYQYYWWDGFKFKGKEGYTINGEPYWSLISNYKSVKSKLRKSFSKNGFNQFTKYFEIKKINGKYYIRGMLDVIARGSDITYRGNDIEVRSINKNKIAFYSIEQYFDEVGYRYKKDFVIVREGYTWKIDDFTLPD